MIVVQIFEDKTLLCVHRDQNLLDCRIANGQERKQPVNALNLSILTMWIKHLNNFVSVFESKSSRNTNLWLLSLSAVQHKILDSRKVSGTRWWARRAGQARWCWVRWCWVQWCWVVSLFAFISPLVALWALPAQECRCHHIGGWYRGASLSDNFEFSQAKFDLYLNSNYHGRWFVSNSYSPWNQYYAQRTATYDQCCIPSSYEPE